MDFFDFSIIRILKKSCRNLKILRLIVCSLVDDNFMNAFSGMKKLKEISLYVYDKSDKSNTVPINSSKILCSIRNHMDKTEFCPFIDGDLASEKIIHNCEWVLEWASFLFIFSKKIKQINDMI